MESGKGREGLCNNHFRYVLRLLTRRFWRLSLRLRWLICRRSKSKVVIRRFMKLKYLKGQSIKKSASHMNGQVGSDAILERPITIATFNVAMFSLAPAIPKAEKSVVFVHEHDEYISKTVNINHPKSILKQSPLHPMINNNNNTHHHHQTSVTKPKMKVSINLPDNEISLAQNKVLSIVGGGDEKNRTQVSMRSPICFPFGMSDYMSDLSMKGGRSIFDVLREVDADILALQDVKAEEEKKMRPLSDLATALGMRYVFAESWAPEYGNAILSKWPIKRWRVQKIFDDQDFRNVLKATINVPWIGELNFHCTQLDHLDENWRMKQTNAIIQSNDCSHILAGGLNSLDGSDYSSERWAHIVKYYEEIGKPTPKVEVTKFLKGKGYVDAKDFTGEFEPVVIIAKGQSVQGTSKYGTRVDYIMKSPDLPYKFVPGSYSVISSKGTSDHHIVKVDIVKEVDYDRGNLRKQHKLKQKFVNITNSCSSRGIWRISP